MPVKAWLSSFALVATVMVSAVTGSAASLTAPEIMALAQQQLAVPCGFVLGEMRVYRGEQLNRLYMFVLGKLWEAETHTESVRIDFKTATNSAPDSASLYTDQRYLLKCTEQTAPTQWLYLPALRRVRLTPYRPDDPLLQSDYLFYDLTTIQDFTDFRYHFLDSTEQTPRIAGEPQSALVPYQQIIVELEKRDEIYLVTGIPYVTAGKERHTRLSGFHEIAPGRYRPQLMVVMGETGEAPG
jgi:hypothetical protein